MIKDYSNPYVFGTKKKKKTKAKRPNKIDKSEINNSNLKNITA